MSFETFARIFRSAVFIMASLFLLIIAIEPRNLGVIGIDAPDLLFPWIAAFLLHRPKSANILAVTFVLALQMVLLDVPVGLWAAIQLCVFEVLRANWTSLNNQGFISRWIWVTLGAIMAHLALAILAIPAFLPMPPYSVHLQQIVITFIAFPLFSFMVSVIFKTRKNAYRSRFGFS